MKKTLLFIASVAAVSLIACNKEEKAVQEPAGQTVVFNMLSQDTKAIFTTPEGTHYPVLWTENDTQAAVTLNYNSTATNADITRSADNKTASFTGTFSSEEAENTFVAVVPVAAVKSINNGEKKLNLEIPTGQTSTATSPDEKAMVLYAREVVNGLPGSVDMTFHHFTGYLHLVFTNYASTLSAAGATVQAVSITSDKEIVGRMFFFPETGATSANAMSKTVAVTTNTLEHVWVALAPVDLSNETLTITVSTDKGTMTKDIKFGDGRNLTSGKIAKINVNMAGKTIKAPVRYNLVTAANQLHVGDKVLIVGANYNVAMSTTQNSNNRASTSVTKGEGYILDPSDAVEVVELEDGAKPGEYALRATGSANPGYLYAPGGGNYLRTAASIVSGSEALGSFEISILNGQANGKNEPSTGTTDNVARVYSSATGNGLIRYNTSGLFSAYALSTTTAFIHLYRLDEDPDNSPRFKAKMPDADGENNVSVGSSGGTLDVYVFGNTAWTASATGGATLDETSGTGNTILTLTVPANASTTDTKVYTVTVSTSAGVSPSSYTFNLTQAKASSGEGAKVNDILWEEWWEGAVKDQLPSDYCGSADKTTVVYNGGSVVYTQSGSGTKMYTDGLVYYKNGTAAADITIDKYRNNLLIYKNNGYLNVSGIPSPGVKTATLTYRSNSAVSKHSVTSSTTGVVVGSLSSTSTDKLNDPGASAKTVTITCTISIPKGTDSIVLKITDKDSSSNIRVTGFELVVTEVW